jgi:hypothetical protein
MMKRSMIALGVAALAVLPAFASASHSGKDGGPRDFAVGSAKNTFPTGEPNHLMVSAHGFQADVTGHVRAKGELLAAVAGPFGLEGEVTCLLVDGNRAAIKYRFKHATGGAALLGLEGGGVQVFVEDNDQPGFSGPDGNTFDPPMNHAGFEAANPRQCDNPNRVYDPVDSGNYVVHDAG